MPTQIRETRRDINVDPRFVAKACEDMSLHLDAGEVAALTRELNFARAGNFDIEYPELKARKLFPLATDVPPGAKTYSVRTWDVAGAAKVVAQMADDIPLVDAFSTEELVRIFTVAVAYQYDVEELEAQQMAGSFQIDKIRQRAAQEAFEIKVDEIAATGIPSAGVAGAVNHPNVPIESVPTGGWATATPDEILKDLYALVQSVPENTLDRHTANTILIPAASFGIISTTPISATNPTSILAQFKATMPWITDITTWAPLNTAGAEGVKRMMVYKRDPTCVELVIPMELREEQPQARNFAFVINCRGRIGGIRFSRPLTAAYMDGI